MAEMWLLSVLTLDATLRVSAPLMLAAMAGVFSERSGVIDIGLEGKMLAAAFTAAAVSYTTGSAWIGLGCAVLASCALSAVHSFACVTHRGDQVVSGLAINLLAAGATASMGIALFQQGGQTPPLSGAARFAVVEWPLVAQIKEIPIVGVVYSELVSGHKLLVYIAFLAVPATAWILFKTRFGLRLRAVGEQPAAADTAGISVEARRYAAGLCAGLLCGLAGAYLSTAQSASFVPNMTAGKGYIALAAMIFGKWRPVPAMLACLLFGFFEALAARLQGVSLFGGEPVPTELISALPYLLTVILLAGFIGKATAPAAIGSPYFKGR